MLDLEKKIVVRVFFFFRAVFWTNLLDLIVPVKQKLSFVNKSTRGGSEEDFLMVWEIFTVLTGLAIIAEDLRGIYDCMVVS